MRRPLVALACFLVFLGESHADVGVSEPAWAAPPIVYKSFHTLSAPEGEKTWDYVEIGNFTAAGATVSMLFVGNGEQLNGAMGEANKIRDDLYVLPRNEEHCTVFVHFYPDRIGIDALEDDIPSDPVIRRFCPTGHIYWLPLKAKTDTTKP